MKFAFVVVVLVALAAVVAAEVKVTSGIAKVGAVSVLPDPPVPGKEFKVAVQGVLSQDLPNGVTAEVSVSFAGVQIFKRTQQINGSFKAGAFSKAVAHQFPALVPKGEYVAKVVLTAGSQLVAEVEFDLKEGVKTSQILDADLVLINDEEFVNALNAVPGTWTAGANARFEGLSLHDAKPLLGTKLGMSPDADVTPLILHSVEAPPASFDARTQWPTCIHPIRDQAQCGSCWAFGATEALSDRFCIASKGAVNVVLSPEDLVSCETDQFGCEGGYLNLAWQYMCTKGTVADKDFPYSAGSGVAPACSKEKAGAKRYKCTNPLNPQGQVSIQTLIQTSGPVEGGFSVYQDFFNYKSGVYTHKSGGLAGGHAIKILGWGVDAGTPYWIVANSWGTSWGNQGFFWIKRGSDECGIEDQIYAGTPAL